MQNYLLIQQIPDPLLAELVREYKVSGYSEMAFGICSNRSKKYPVLILRKSKIQRK